jgi:hypothetical protein
LRREEEKRQEVTDDFSRDYFQAAGVLGIQGMRDSAAL